MPMLHMFLQTLMQLISVQRHTQDVSNRLEEFGGGEGRLSANKTGMGIIPRDF